MDAMSEAVAEGLIRAVGVSNYSASQTEKAHDLLLKHNIPLASNQVKYSLLDRRPERSGLVSKCKELRVTIIAYSPLEKGILTGKYNQHNIPRDNRAWRYNIRYLRRIELLINELQTIGRKYNGKTAGQVSLNWLISKGAVPIPGTKSIDQAIANAGAMGWKLSNEDVLALDAISEMINR
jgi:aryl-alcohol dehydrogenase-like predicted oxidoreductase